MEPVSSLVSVLSLKVNESKCIEKNTEAGQLYWILSQILSQHVAKLVQKSSRLLHFDGIPHPQTWPVVDGF